MAIAAVGIAPHRALPPANKQNPRDPGGAVESRRFSRGPVECATQDHEIKVPPSQSIGLVCIEITHTQKTCRLRESCTRKLLGGPATSRSRGCWIGPYQERTRRCKNNNAVWTRDKCWWWWRQAGTAGGWWSIMHGCCQCQCFYYEQYCLS